MDRLGARPQRRLDDAVAPQVALGRRPLADEVRLVRGGDVERAAIGLGVDGDGADPELAERPEDPHGDLAAVGNEDLRERPAWDAYSPPR